jgi:proteasome assembly chaperone (PAC2) family protein
VIQVELYCAWPYVWIIFQIGDTMNELLRLWEKPPPAYMIAGWRQWADGGDVSSGLPQYLIDHTDARRIGEIGPDGFYLFQIPGTHHLVRPTVRLDDGYREELETKRNEFFYSEADGEGFLIFLGEEPHLNEERYAETFFDAVEELGVRRVAAVAGVCGAVPYDKDRNVSCVYSLSEMKDELSNYAVKFSSYEGGATISMYLAHHAESRDIEFFRFCAYVPLYDFSTSSMSVHPTGLDEDFKAWYDLLRRLDHMFKLGLDLKDLQGRSDELIPEWDARIDHLARAMPQLEVRDYMEKVNSEFEELSFEPLSDLWEEELRGLLEDL